MCRDDANIYHYFCNQGDILLKIILLNYAYKDGYKDNK